MGVINARDVAHIRFKSLKRDAALKALAASAYRLSAADARLRGRATQMPGALSMTHARVLRVLVERGPMTIGQLARETELTGAATTQLTNGLVAAGYVERTRGEADRRTVTVRLTEKGLERHRQRKSVLNQFLDDRLATFSEDELHASARIMQELISLYDLL